MLDKRDFQIISQNLLNRATDMEIYNAEAERRTVKFENIEANFEKFKAFLGSQIGAYNEKYDAENPPKPSYNKFNKGGYKKY